MADVITRLKVESSEYESKIKRAAASIQNMEQNCRKVGGTFQVVEKEQLELVKGLGRMETVSKSARGRLGELTTAFTDLRSQYNRLTQEEKQSPFGKAMNESLNQLNARIKESKKELADINKELNGGGSKLGQFGGIIDGIGQKMGINANLTELLTSKTALMATGIGAATTAVVAATKAWADYNSEMAKQGQITTVTTGLKGDDADRMTDAARSLSKVYGGDFREVINAANTLMAQFGVTGDEAIQLIRDGMQGMIYGDAPKLLSMIQQYAPAFQSAGVSASQLVAVIHNSEGGIFTDQNMNAVVMGIKNIRLMTNSTAEALSKLGIDGQKMSQDLNDGTLTVFDALKQVATALEGVNSNSQAAGEVMQAVFGRQGAMAGTNLGKAIATLNTNLENTKTQTGELGRAYADLELANERLNKAIRDCFEYDGWQKMKVGLQSELVNAISAVLEQVAKVKTLMGDIEHYANILFNFSPFEAIMSSAENALGPLGNVLHVLRQINRERVNSTGGGADIGGGLAELVQSKEQETPPYRPELPKQPHKKMAPTISGGIPGLSAMQGIADPSNLSALNQLIDKLAQLQSAKASAGSVTDYFTAQIGEQQTERAISSKALELPVTLQEGWLDKIQEQANEGMAQLSEGIKGIDIEPAKKMSKWALNSAKDWAKASSAVASVGSALQMIEDPAAKVAGIIGEAIANIALTFAMSLEGTVTPWDWIAAAAAGTATMVSTIAAIKSATAGSYAEGGIIPGNSYSGDNQWARVNAGELILSRSQQSTLAANLNGPAFGDGMHLETYISGEQLRVVLQRNSLRRGKGEYITSKMRY